MDAALDCRTTRFDGLSSNSRNVSTAGREAKRRPTRAQAFDQRRVGWVRKPGPRGPHLSSRLLPDGTARKLGVAAPSSFGLERSCGLERSWPLVSCHPTNQDHGPGTSYTARCCRFWARPSAVGTTRRCAAAQCRNGRDSSRLGLRTRHTWQRLGCSAIGSRARRGNE